MKKVVIIGDSGHAKIVADIVNSTDGMNVYAKLDDKYTKVFIEDGFLKGPVNHLHELIKIEPSFGVVIGIGSNLVRKKIVGNLELDPSQYLTAVHSSAVVSSSAKIGIGTVVMPGAIVNADARIGEHAIINSGSVVEHDCVVSDYCHVSPLAIVTGGVTLGEGVHVGAGASIIPLKQVGEWSTVGAGAVVVSDINAKVTVVGVPAKVVKKEGL